MLRLLAGLVWALLLLVYHAFVFVLPDCLRSHKSLAGKVAIVTGTGSGIGRALAVQLARHGATLVLWSLVAETNDVTLKMVKEECSGCDAMAVTIDVADRRAVFEGVNLGISRPHCSAAND